MGNHVSLANDQSPITPQVVSDLWIRSLKAHGITAEAAQNLATRLLNFISLGDSIRGLLYIEPGTGTVWWHRMTLAVMLDEPGIADVLIICTSSLNESKSASLTRHLSSKPRPIENRIYHLHTGLKKLGEIKYQRFIQPLHTGLLRYAEQMQEVSSQKRSHNLGNSLSSTLILLRALPDEKTSGAFESILASLDEIASIKLTCLDGRPYHSTSYPRMRLAFCLLINPDLRQIPFKTVKPHSKLPAVPSRAKGEFDLSDDDIGADGSPDDECSVESDIEDAGNPERRLAHYTRGVTALAHYTTRTDTSVLPIRICADLLSCLAADSSHTIAAIILTLAITLGRSIHQIAQSIICRQLDESLVADRLVFCLSDGCLYYRPQKYLFPDSVLAKVTSTDTVTRQHQKRYYPTALVYQIPLSTHQRREIAYLSRHHAAENTSFALALNPSGESWADADTTELLRTLNDHIKRLHPGYRTITGQEFARSYIAHGHHLAQLDSVVSYFITGYLPKRLEMPIRYTLVNSNMIGQTNERVDDALRSALAQDLNKCQQH